MPTRSPFGPADDAHAEPRDPEVEEARRAELRARLDADRQTVEMLAAAGFQGPVFDLFAHQLISRGHRTMTSWTITKKIFRVCAKHKIYLTEIEWSEDDRQYLVQDTVTIGYDRFRRGALLERDWKPEGGATLGTYFTGGLIFAFSEQYRKWCRQESKRWLRARELVPEMGLVLADRTQRVGAAVVDRDTARRALQELARQSPRLAKIVALTAEGYSQEEIVEMLADGTTVRAVEGVLRRLRLSQTGKGPCR